VCFGSEGRLPIWVAFFTFGSMNIKQTSGPVLTDILSTADLKAHCRVDHSSEDALLGTLRSVAFRHIEAITGVLMGDRTAEAYMDTFRNGARFPIHPINSITSVEYLATDGTLTVLDPSFYYSDLVSNPSRIYFHDVPELQDFQVNRVKISMDVGHPEDECPEDLVHAVKLLVGHLYENRQNAEAQKLQAIPYGIHALCTPFRNFAL
jgi:uncharacterized phiE125 gp8 family phage protein